MDLVADNLILEERPQTFTECLFSLNVALLLTSAVSFDTAPDIDLSKEQINQSIGKRVIKLPHSQKVQKEQFQGEQHTESALKGVISPLPSAQTSLSLASSW